MKSTPNSDFIPPILLFLLFVNLLSCSPNPSDENIWLQDFNTLKKQFAPDTRVEVFEFTKDAVNNQITFKTSHSEAINALQELSNKYKISAEIIELPTKELRETSHGIVILSVGNIRTKPGHSQEMATQTLMGTPLRLLEKKGGWYRVQTSDQYIGWTEDDTFQKVTQDALNEWIASEKVIYTSNSGSVFEKPDEKSNTISDISAGNILKKMNSFKQFTEVQFADGRQGWVKTEEITSFTMWKTQNVPSATELLQTAKRFMGVPYLWGGTSYKGVDCSGFTKMTFFTHGIQLPRDASQQVHAGFAVDTDTTLKNLEPGDLLFFGEHATDIKPEKVTHVGIYMGDNKIIHSSGRVRIESLKRGEPTFNEYRLKSFLSARRVLNSIGSDGIIPVKNLLY